MDLTLIPKLLEAPKKLYSLPGEWSIDSRKRKLANFSELMFCDDYPDLLMEIRLTAYIEERTERGHYVLLLNGATIARMSLNSKTRHVNGFNSKIPQNLRGLTLEAGSHKFYDWNNDCVDKWPPSPPIRIAEHVVLNSPEHKEGINHFCSRINYSNYIEPPEHRPTLEL